MKVSYSEVRTLNAIASAVVMTLGVPVNEVWTLVEAKGCSNANRGTLFTMLVNGDEKYKFHASQDQESIVVNQEIPSGAEILVSYNKIVADAEVAGIQLLFEVDNV